jgi:hypothetical protein
MRLHEKLDTLLADEQTGAAREKAAPKSAHAAST